MRFHCVDVNKCERYRICWMEDKGNLPSASQFRPLSPNRRVCVGGGGAWLLDWALRGSCFVEVALCHYHVVLCSSVIMIDVSIVFQIAITATRLSMIASLSKVSLRAISEITEPAHIRHITQTGDWLYMSSTETTANAVMIKATVRSHILW